MLDDHVKNLVKKATLKILETYDGKGGQAVLVDNGFILTAAHCIDFSTDGSLVLGEHSIIELDGNNRKIKVAPHVLEPMSDIAVLGPLDSQTFHQEVSEFESFLNSIEPVPICFKLQHSSEKYPVHVFTHKREWISGYATSPFDNSPMIWVEMDKQIEGGTSGSPIVDDEGRIVGIISSISEGTDFAGINGLQPFPGLALPLWVLNQIEGE